MLPAPLLLCREGTSGALVRVTSLIFLPYPSEKANEVDSRISDCLLGYECTKLGIKCSIPDVMIFVD